MIMDEKKEEYKGYNLGLMGSFALVRITAKGQGKVPKPLQGSYTTTGHARAAVDSYLNSLKKGGRSGKKTKSSSTD